MPKFGVGDHIDNKFLHGEVVKVEAGHYYVKCDKCGYENKRFPNQILRGLGCGACSGRTLVKGVNDIPTTDPWMVKFFPGGKEEASNYTRNCSKKFIPICPECGRISDKTTTPNRLTRDHKISCVCNDGVTIPNKVIRNLMEQALNLKIISSYEKEFQEIDEKGYLRRFDMKFYDLNSNPYFVEMDGE